MLKTDVIDWYTKDKNGKFGKNPKLVRYIYPPLNMECVNFDLNRANPDDIWKEQDDWMQENIDTLLEWVIKNRKGEEGEAKLVEAEFVCYRGLLTKIMCTPYEDRDDLRICAIKAKGSIYMCRFNTQEYYQTRARFLTKPDYLMATRCGSVFNEYMLTSNPGVRPDLSLPLSEFAEFGCVFKSQIGQHKLLYCAEIAGLGTVEELDKLNTAKFYELKCFNENTRENFFRRYKLLGWWSQCYLANIDTIVVGFRTNTHYVNAVKKMRVKDMPYEADGWSASYCVEALRTFLSFAKQTMEDATENDVFEFFWRANGTEFTSKKLEEGNNCFFLPLWYQEWMAKMP